MPPKAGGEEEDTQAVKQHNQAIPEVVAAHMKEKSTPASRRSVIKQTSMTAGDSKQSVVEFGFTEDPRFFEYYEEYKKREEARKKLKRGGIEEEGAEKSPTENKAKKGPLSHLKYIQNPIEPLWLRNTLTSMERISFTL